MRTTPTTTRVSQIRVGSSAWYWYPVGLAVAVELPYHPLASTSTLMVPAALYTHRASCGPPVLVGPSSTMTRFARTTPGRRLIVEVPVGVQWPLESVGKRLR